jgi:hypothetical protein
VWHRHLACGVSGRLAGTRQVYHKKRFTSQALSFGGEVALQIFGRLEARRPHRQDACAPSAFILAREAGGRLVCQRIMTFLLREIVGVIAISLLLFCASCEKHPLGEMPEVQREQIDPAKAWHQATEMDSEKSSSSPTPAEFFPVKRRP